MTAVILVTIIGGLLVNELCEFSPWLARKIARWSALCRYSDRDRAETRAEELEAVINERPGNLFKVCSALWFAGAAVTVRCRDTDRAARLRVARVFAGTTVALFGASGVASGIAILVTHGMPATEFIGGVCMAACWTTGGIIFAVGHPVCPLCPIAALLGCASNVAFYLEKGGTAPLAWAAAWFAGLAVMTGLEVTTHIQRMQIRKVVAEHAAQFPDCLDCPIPRIAAEMAR